MILGSAAADGSGCVNLSDRSVGGRAAKSIDPASIRVSAMPPATACPTTGGAPVHDLTRSSRYRSHIEDLNGDGIADLRVHADTSGIGGTAATEVLYLSGRFQDAGGPLGDACFVAVAPVDVASGACRDADADQVCD